MNAATSATSAICVYDPDHSRSVDEISRNLGKHPSAVGNDELIDRSRVWGQTRCFRRRDL